MVFVSANSAPALMILLVYIFFDLNVSLVPGINCSHPLGKLDRLLGGISLFGY